MPTTNGANGKQSTKLVKSSEKPVKEKPSKEKPSKEKPTKEIVPKAPRLKKIEQIREELNKVTKVDKAPPKVPTAPDVITLPKSVFENLIAGNKPKPERKKRVLSEEQKNVLRERLVKAREMRKTPPAPAPIAA